MNISGHVISPGKLEVTEKSGTGMDGLQTLKHVTELRSSLRLCNAFRRLVNNFACVAALLNKELRKEHPFHFTGLDEEAVNARM